MKHVADISSLAVGWNHPDDQNWWRSLVACFSLSVCRPAGTAQTSKPVRLVKDISIWGSPSGPGLNYHFKVGVDGGVPASRASGLPRRRVTSSIFSILITIFLWSQAFLAAVMKSVELEWAVRAQRWRMTAVCHRRDADGWRIDSSWEQSGAGNSSLAAQQHHTSLFTGKSVEGGCRGVARDCKVSAFILTRQWIY